MYGLTLTLAILICLLLAESLVKRSGKDINVLWGVALYSIIGGIVGARLYHVMHLWNYYGDNPIKIFEIWNGGLGIFGALIGGLLGAVIYLKLKKEVVWEWLDIAGLVLPLGQVIGRWGNFFNRELYPYFLYESALDFLLFLALIYRHSTVKTPSSPKPGRTFALYLLGYSLIRFFLEPLRTDPWRIYNLNTAQLVSIILAGGALLILRRRNGVISQ